MMTLLRTSWVARWLPWLGLIFLLGLLSACGGQAATPAAVYVTQEVETVVTQVVEVPGAEVVVTSQPTTIEIEGTKFIVVTKIVTVTPAKTEPPAVVVTPPAPSVTRPPAEIPPTLPLSSRVTAAAPATPIAEARIVELEWPPTLRLGDSDVIRLALLPSSDGYTVTVEYPEHDVVTRTVTVDRALGYSLSAAARLDGVGFTLAPQGEQSRLLPVGEAVTWRWTISPNAPGQQRLSVTLLLRWTREGATAPERESTAFSRTLDVRVLSFLGLSQTQAMAGGLFGLLVGGGIGFTLLVVSPRSARSALRTLAANPALVIEPKAGLQVNANERSLLSALFSQYQRLSLESEFLSGYSGARTFLARPIRPDGRADADTIIKIGDAASIVREYDNYENFVKDTLPPVTARIQHAPVVVSGVGAGLVGFIANSINRSRPAPTGINQTRPTPTTIRRAALQYTFIGEPGRQPLSLRRALLDNPDPALLEKLFETFAPNWWMQRRPYTFRLALEYDRLLPAHIVLEPARGRGKLLDARAPLGEAGLSEGELVTLHRFTRAERRPDGRGLTLTGPAAPGQPPLRVRWQALNFSNGDCGRVVGNRHSLLSGLVSGFDLFGLPDPLATLPALLQESVSGTRSVIHGDLNLENVLLGPGGLVWLIDFAQTREGHTLFDFAHLEAEIIAHLLAPRYSAEEYCALLNGASPEAPYVLRFTLQALAGRCLFNPSQPREYDLALYLACLGALKFTNLDAHARHLLYLTAAAKGGKLMNGE